MVQIKTMILLCAMCNLWAPKISVDANSKVYQEMSGQEYVVSELYPGLPAELDMDPDGLLQGTRLVCLKSNGEHLQLLIRQIRYDENLQIFSLRNVEHITEANQLFRHILLEDREARTGQEPSQRVQDWLVQDRILWIDPELQTTLSALSKASGLPEEISYDIIRQNWFYMLTNAGEDHLKYLAEINFVALTDLEQYRTNKPAAIENFKFPMLCYGLQYMRGSFFTVEQIKYIFQINQVFALPEIANLTIQNDGIFQVISVLAVIADISSQESVSILT